jgi:glyoxylase I family protein
MIVTCDMVPLLAVFDMPTAMRSYCGVLGCQTVRSDGKPTPEFDWGMLSLNGAELMLNTAYEAPARPPQPERTRIAAHKDISLYFGCPDVDGVYDHLRARGVDVNAPRVAWYGMKQLYVTDPDGYVLCFQWMAEPRP